MIEIWSIIPTGLPLNQCVASHTTMMNDEGGVRGGEYWIFKTNS